MYIPFILVMPQSKVLVPRNCFIDIQDNLYYIFMYLSQNIILPM